MEDTEGKIMPGTSLSLVVLVSTLFLGGAILVIGYIVSRLSRSNKSPDSTKNGTESEKVKYPDSRDSASRSSTTIANSGSSNKRAKNKKRRETQQEFTHSWVVGALKGHTASVLDINFSSNGKYLATCAEDCGLLLSDELLETRESERYQACKVNGNTVSRSTQGNRNNSFSDKSTSSSTGDNAADTTPTISSSRVINSQQTKEDRTILSRRQRKNRTRTPRDHRRREICDDEHEDENATSQEQGHRHHRRQPHYQQNSNGGQPSTELNRNVAGLRRNKVQMASMMNRQFRSVHRRELGPLSDAAIESLLRRYTLSRGVLVHLGYPVECASYPGFVVVVKHHQHPITHNSESPHRLDVNAQEFVPGGRYTTDNEGGDSGHCTGSSVENSDLEQESSSDSDKYSENGEPSSSASSSAGYYPPLNPEMGYEIPLDGRDFTPEPSECLVAERKCARCHKNFYVNRETGDYLVEEKCQHHWGKLKGGPAFGMSYRMWECCRGREGSRGCTSAKMHVWSGLTIGLNGPFDGYVQTRPAGMIPKDGNYGVYALDCEMCFTKRGLELTKVSVVSLNGDVVYDTLVKPDDEVIDYNTRFSGITADDLEKATKTLRDVQMDLTNFIYSETIVIGHGLENDFRALRLLHDTVIDTCVTFPHYLGYPYRSSLKTLARTILRRDIQVAEHDSVEDARIVLDIMLRKIKHDLIWPDSNAS